MCERENERVVRAGAIFSDSGDVVTGLAQEADALDGNVLVGEESNHTASGRSAYNPSSNMRPARTTGEQAPPLPTPRRASPPPPPWRLARPAPECSVERTLFAEAQQKGDFGYRNRRVGKVPLGEPRHHRL